MRQPAAGADLLQLNYVHSVDFVLHVSTMLLCCCRSGVTDVIFPQGNQKEYEEVPEDLKQGITPHFVDNYEQIFQLAFPASSSQS